MITAFKNYLLSLSLSPISRKLYLSDIRRFLAFIGGEPTLDQLSQDKYYLTYLASLSAQSIAPSMLKRTTASLRQFTTFLSHSYGIMAPSLSSTESHTSPSAASVKQGEDYIKPFSKYLTSQHLSPLTIKSYKSDITRYLDWAQSNIASNQMSDLLTEKNIEKYLNHLSETLDALTSTIDRKSKSIARFQAWFRNVCDQESISDNIQPPQYAPKPTYHAPQATSYSLSRLPSPGMAILSVKNAISRTLEKIPVNQNFNYRGFATLAVLLVFATTLGIFGYRSFSRDTKLIAAYPSTPVTPNRNLSFQGRLEDAGGTPITAATNFEFKLWDDLTVGTQLYTTGTCSITPDADGVFSTQIGSTCGSAIGSSVFTENANIFLEVKVAAETLTPRQPISSVAYALNSETIQGFPISSTISAIRNTIVPMNQWGEIIIGEQNPRMTGVSGNFQISAPSLTLSTSANGDIALSPNGTGQVNINSNSTILGDLTITGDDLFMGTNTAGLLLIADGTNFNPTAMTGDVTITGGGVTSIGSDRITEAMLKSVNGPTDELCLSYESTVGDFEWQSCGSGSNWSRVAGNLSPLVMNDTISATTSAAVAMTLTQTGAFNALLVEDQASDTTPFVINQDGYVGVGTSAPALPFHVWTGNAGTDPAWFPSSGDSILIEDDTNAIIQLFAPTAGFLEFTDSAARAVGMVGYYHSDNHLQFNTNSAEAMRISSVGNVGIGSTTPTAKLDVAGDASVSGHLVMRGSGTNYIHTLNGSNFGISTSPGGDTGLSERLTLLNGGNVGIGDTTPAAMLTVGNGDLFQVNSSGIISNIDGVAHTIDDVGGNLTLTSNSTAISLADDVYLSSGLSTFGTAVSDGTVEATQFCTGDGETNCVTDFSTFATGTNYWTRSAGNISPLTLNDTLSATTSATVAMTLTQTGAFNALLVEDQASDTTPFVIDQSGNVGIGTSSPADVLTITGTGTNLMSVTRTGSSFNVPIRLSNDTNSVYFGMNSNEDFAVGSGIDLLSTNQFMVQRATGNVGIGTTTPTAKIDVAGDASVSGHLVMRGSGTNYIHTLNGSNFGISTSVGGDTGLSEKFTVLNNGNIGIGDTTPTATLTVGSGDLFQVAGATGNVTTAGDVAINGDDLTSDGTLGVLAATGLNLQATTGTVTIDSIAAGQTLNLGNSNVARTVNIGSGTGIDTINIGTGATAADVITFGNTGAASTFTFNSGASTTNPLTFDFDTVTTGTATDLSVDGLTTGTGLLIDNNVASSLTTGTLFQAQSVATSLTTAGDAFLGYFNWNPGSATTATGDLFRINIGANGTATNLFNITDNGTSLFSVSETAVTSNIPTNFTSAGDVSMSYDLNFTNLTSSTIQSASQFYINAGETYDSSDMTLTTYNKGNIIADTEAFVTTGAATVSGTLRANGNTIFNGLTYAWPASHTASGVLQNDGTGGLTWATLGAGAVTPDSLDFTEFIDNMTLDASTNIAASGTNVLSITNTGTGNSFLVNDEAADTTPFVIDQSGNVGIGNTTANAPLQIYSDTGTGTGAMYLGTGANAATMISAQGRAYFGYSAGNLAVVQGALTKGIQFNVNNNTFGSGEAMRIESTGLVGIGTTGPDAKLDVASTTEQLRLTYTDGTVYSSHTVDSSGNLTIDNTGTRTIVADDLQITGDDLYMNTNTAGMLLIADGTNFNPTAVSGDITISGAGTTAVGADKITEAMLKSVNGPTDEFCLTYESTVGDFEWQTCGSTSDWTRVAGNLSPAIMNDTISATTSAAVALTLTQTGAFNALLVQDQASDTTPFIIDQSGNMAVGGTINSIEGVAHTVEDVSGNLSLTSAGTSVVVADDLAVNGATSADITSTTSTATVFDSTVTNLSIGSAATTLNLGTGTAANAINIGTGGTAADTLTFGNIGVATTFTFNSGASTTNPLTFDFDTVTTGTATDLSVDGLTTGTGLLIDNNVASSITTGTLFQAQSVATSLTTAADAFLGYFNWNPGSATTAVGDLFRINIGANGTATNLFNLTDNGSSLFSVSETTMTSNLPANFTSAGDVSMAYDLNFTNPTISSITSAAPLTVVAGESFNSSNLTLKTYNSGDVVIDAAGGVTLNQAQAWDLANSSVTALNIEGGLLNLDTTNSRVGIGTAAPGTTLDVAGASVPTIRIYDTAGAGPQLVLKTGGNQYNIIGSGGGGTGGGVKFNQSGVSGSDIVFTGDGLVGIGDTTPLQHLVVSATEDNVTLGNNTTAAARIVNSYSAAFGRRAELQFGISDTQQTSQLAVIAAEYTNWDATNIAGGALIFGTKKSTSATISERMRINQDGLVGIGTTVPDGKFQVTGAATGKALAIFNETGDQSLLTASASGITKFTVASDGTVYGTKFQELGASNYLDPNNGGTALDIAGDILKSAAATFNISSTSNNNIVLGAGTGQVRIGSTGTGTLVTESIISTNTNANIVIAPNGTGTVVIGVGGAGKLDAATIDPPYTINGAKFATYMASMTGVKEETTGNIYASQYVSGVGYRATLDLATSIEGSDIWLFSKTTNLKHNLDKMVVLLSAAGNTKTWYDIDAQSGKLYLYSLSPTTISYRLTAPRYDAQNWLNTRDINAGAGLIVNDTSDWSVSDAITSVINAGKTQVAQLFGDIETNLISPLDTSKAITITAPVAIKPTSSTEPALSVDGEILAATISARTAILNDVQAETITAKNIVADTITANHIEGLDARIASLSGKLSDQDITSITDRIKNRLDILTGNLPDASDLPTPAEATGSAILDTSTPASLESSIATGSAILSSLSADFATINGYLAVIGQATMTDLDVTNVLYTSRIDSKTGTINLAGNTLIVDSTGTVAINGDLVVSGKVLADSASLNTLELGTPADATSSSALGQLLSIYNESGVAVATIDASGSANLASLTTNMITISGSTDATSSALLTSNISSTATAGVSTLVSPDTELTISSPYVTKDTLVYLTPTTNTQNKVLFVKSKNTCDESSPVSCVPSFTIGIDSAATSDISFNWWIIQVK